MAYTVVYQVYRKEGMSSEEFRRYWTEVHAPIAAKLPKVRSYVNYAVTAATDAPDPVPDGFTILEFDSEEDANEAMASEEMAASGADAANFTSRFGVFNVEPQRIV
jgi:uncharacterized protein (TIGR02118 family)